MRWFELSLSEYSISGWKAKMVKFAPRNLSKNRLFLEPLGKPCVKRLPVLNYEGRGLKGLLYPLGFETDIIWAYPMMRTEFERPVVSVGI